MGLDMYAYVASKAGQYSEFYETAEFDKTANEFVSKTVNKPYELAYWRKHPNLHGWMEQLLVRKRHADGYITYFNGVELELTWDDLDAFEEAVKNNTLPDTSGFFFGNNANEHYREQDLEFIKNARAELFMGLKVFYNSSW